jgi:predicted ATPase
VALPYYGALLADMLLRSSQPAGALELVEETIALAQRTGERVQMPELMRIKASALVALGRPADALPVAREAVAVAERQQAVLHEVRCLLLLARLRRSTPEIDGVMRDLYTPSCRFAAVLRRGTSSMCARCWTWFDPGS